MKRILVGNFSFSFFISFRHADRLFTTSCFFNSTMQSLGVRLSSLGWLLLEVTQKTPCELTALVALIIETS